MAAGVIGCRSAARVPYARTATRLGPSIFRRVGGPAAAGLQWESAGHRGAVLRAHVHGTPCPPCLPDGDARTCWIGPKLLLRPNGEFGCASKLLAEKGSLDWLVTM